MYLDDQISNKKQQIQLLDQVIGICFRMYGCNGSLSGSLSRVGNTLTGAIKFADPGSCTSQITQLNRDNDGVVGETIAACDRRKNQLSSETMMLEQEKRSIEQRQQREREEQERADRAREQNDTVW